MVDGIGACRTTTADSAESQGMLLSCVQSRPPKGRRPRLGLSPVTPQSLLLPGTLLLLLHSPLP
jgi:hypothetical protein